MLGGSWVKGIKVLGSAFSRTPIWMAINACLALVLLFLVLLPYPWTPSANPQGNTYEEQYQADCDKADSRYRKFMSEPQYSGEYDDGTKYDAEKASLADELVTWCDLAAQHFAASGATSAAKSSWFTFWTAAFGVALLILTLWEAHAVTSVTRKIGQEQTRARLEIEHGHTMGIYTNSKTRLHKDGICKFGGLCDVVNDGKSPALKVMARARLEIKDISKDQILISTPYSKFINLGNIRGGDYAVFNSHYFHMESNSAEDFVCPGAGFIVLHVEVLFSDVFGVCRSVEARYFQYAASREKIDAKDFSRLPQYDREKLAEYPDNEDEA